MALWKKLALGFLVLLIVIALLPDEKENTPPHSSPIEQKSTEKTPDKPQIGVPISAGYFEVVIHKAYLSPTVNTGNEFADISAPEGSQFVILKTTFKNVDSESRMILDGKIEVNYQGKNYEFDKAETIAAEGWGLFLDQINPLTSKTTNLVYTIPKEVKGPAYYVVGRSDARIYLGDF